MSVLKPKAALEGKIKGTTIQENNAWNYGKFGNKKKAVRSFLAEWPLIKQGAIGDLTRDDYQPHNQPGA
jgi:hypothetical protein